MDVMPALSDAHKKLNILVGSWEGEEIMKPSPWDEKGGRGTATILNRSILDGFAVLQEYTQKRDSGIKFHGLGFFRYDLQQCEYETHWWDSMGMAANVFRGQFEGTTMSLKAAAHGGFTRITFEFPESDSYAFKMDVSPDGREWKNFMEGNYQRK